VASAETVGPVRVGLSLMPEPEFAAATLPLFADDLVDTVEWSFDMGWGPSGVPIWLDDLLDDFAADGALDGHGVSFSLLSHHPRQDAWLARLGAELARRPYRRVSEHLGFMAAGPFDRGSPLPMPHHPDVVAHARRQADRLAERVGAPVGIENLATALSRSDVTGQGALCAAIAGPVGGWLVLDLHNLWCQAVNAGLDAVTLLEGYPSALVRELHLSGGSWWSGPDDGRVLRRDTHDGAVPEPVLGLLTTALAHFPAVDTVVLERIGSAFGDPTDDEGFRRDFVEIRARCGATT
jgi:uncharacterized protein (UPF0276 family)